MEIAVSICGTISRNEELRTVKVRGFDGCQFDLHRPLTQSGRHRNRSCFFFSFCCHFFLHFQQFALAAGASAGCFAFFRHICLYSPFVISRRFPFHKCDSTCGTYRQAIPQTVTVVISEQCGFAVYHTNGAFVAGLRTQTTAVTFFFINLYNSTNHVVSSSFFRPCFSDNSMLYCGKIVCCFSNKKEGLSLWNHQNWHLCPFFRAFLPKI